MLKYAFVLIGASYILFIIKLYFVILIVHSKKSEILFQNVKLIGMEIKCVSIKMKKSLPRSMTGI